MVELQNVIVAMRRVELSIILGRGGGVVDTNEEIGGLVRGYGTVLVGRVLSKAPLPLRPIRIYASHSLSYL